MQNIQTICADETWRNTLYIVLYINVVLCSLSLIRVGFVMNRFRWLLESTRRFMCNRHLSMELMGLLRGTSGVNDKKDKKFRWINSGMGVLFWKWVNEPRSVIQVGQTCSRLHEVWAWTLEICQAGTWLSDVFITELFLRCDGQLEYLYYAVKTRLFYGQ